MQHFGDSTATKRENENVTKFDAHNISMFGSGDNTLIDNFLSNDEADTSFANLIGGEIQYQQWHHMPDNKKNLVSLSRLKIAMADTDENGWIPHYRFPVNNQEHHGVIPFSETVRKIKNKLIEKTGIQYNHAVVLLYRDGNDCIGFHKDKVLDLLESAPIASISLGQNRVYMLRDNIHNPTKSQEIILSHGTLLLLGMETNNHFYHSIPMTGQQLTPRVSLTFRVVKTFKNINTGELRGTKYGGANWPTELGGTHIEYPDEILKFWFGENKDTYNGGLWWHRKYHDIAGTNIENIDEYIKNKWGHLLRHYEDPVDLFGNASHYLKYWMSYVDGIMGLILLFDQFSRHIYRGSNKSFYFDNYAVALSKHLLQNFNEIPVPYKMFAYVTFMHSEDISLVITASLELLKLADLNDLSSNWKIGLIKTAKVCHEHLEILKKFGRYPHRNLILERQHTVEEMNLMASNNLPQWMKSVSNTQNDAGTNIDKPLKVKKEQNKQNKQKLKILVLHSNRQTASTFRNKTQKYLENKLNHIADLTYPNAPKIYETTGNSHHTNQKKKYVIDPDNANVNAGRVWWIATDDPNTMIYNGLEDSLAFIDSYFKNDYFDGIIGFSQGGALAGIIAALVNDHNNGKKISPLVENIAKSLKFVAMISGFYCRDTRPEFRNCLIENVPISHSPENVIARKDLISIPSFHIWGLDDTLVDPWRSLKLSEAFSDKKICVHNFSHFARAIKYWAIDDMAVWLEKFVTTLHKTHDDAVLMDYPNARLLHEALTKSYNDQDIYDMLLQACKNDTSLWNSLIMMDTTETNQKFRNILVMMISNALCDEYKKYYVNKSIGIPSKLVMYAPKYNNIYRTSRLYHDVSVYLAGLINIFDETKIRIDETNEKRQLLLSYNQYRKIISRLNELLKPPAEISKIKKHVPRNSLEQLMNSPVSDYILRPRAEPVDVSSPELLEPLYNFLKCDIQHDIQHDMPNKIPFDGDNDSSCHMTNRIDDVMDRTHNDVVIEKTFEKGTICADKRLDLCKQVIGPVGVNKLIESLEIDSLSSDPKVKHLLLGNNICGNELGYAIGKFIKSGKSALTTWYIAGNNLDENGIAPICEALCGDNQVKQLWLKRNPIYASGIPHIVNMLNHNTYLKVLDLTNIGLMDDGAVILFNGTNATLEYMYLGCNGLTEKTSNVIAERLHLTVLKQIALGCNRLGCIGAKYLANALIHPKCPLELLEIASCGIGENGAKYIADALKINKSLIELNIGYLKATSDLEEVPNLFGSIGATYIADMLSVNKTLRSLDLTNTGIQQSGINAIASALSTHGTKLIHFNLDQFGIPHNELTKEIIRLAVQQNIHSLNNDELNTINNRIVPVHLKEIKSVYRVQQRA